MNGRVYDPGMGRFLSVDPIIQSPGNSQSLNPYTYLMNNPLAGTDPTGYIGVNEIGHDDTYWKPPGQCTFDIKCKEISGLALNNNGVIIGGGGKNSSETSSTEEQSERENQDSTNSKDVESIPSSGLSLDDIKKDPLKWIESLEIDPEGSFSTNDEINASINEINSEGINEFGDISSTKEQREFAIKAHSVIGGKIKEFNENRDANTELELIIEIRTSPDGEFEVSRAFLASLGSEFSLNKDTEFVIHWHHQTNDFSPGRGDAIIGRRYGIPNFANVMKRGGRWNGTFEIGRQQKVFQQRRLNSSTGKPGKWKNSSKWHEIWNE